MSNRQSSVAIAYTGWTDEERQGDRAPALGRARRRKAATERRLRWLEARWRDEAYFRAVMAAGRYLKLCMLMEWASEADAAASCDLATVEALIVA